MKSVFSTTSTYKWREFNDILSVGELPPNADVSYEALEFGRGFNIRIRRYILSKEAPERIECSYPADWWEAFKERWLPGWAKKFWPVRMVKKTWDIAALFPDAGVPRRLGERHLVLFDHLTTEFALSREEVPRG